MVAPVTLPLPYTLTPAAALDRAKFGLIVYLVSKAMFFVALIGAYIVLSNTQGWPPTEGPQLTIARALPATILLGVSALSALVAPIAIRRGRVAIARGGLAVTFALGMVFLALQVAEWISLYRQDLQQTSYGQFFFVLTAFHQLYIATGLVLLGIVLSRACAGRYDASRHGGIDLTALWWHFCGGVWLLLFAAIYILPELRR